MHDNNNLSLYFGDTCFETQLQVRSEENFDGHETGWRAEQL